MTQIIVTSREFWAVFPDFFLFVALCGLLIASTFKECKPWLHALSQLAIWITVLLLWSGSAQLDGSSFVGHFIRTNQTNLLKIITLITVSISLFYAKGYLIAQKKREGDFYLITLFAAFGMLTLTSAGSFLTLYLGLEIMSLAMYALVALNRDNGHSAEAAIKYFVLGSVSSAILLFGIALVYGATGSILFQEINGLVPQVITSDGKSILMLGAALLLLGISFKFGLVPFHGWVADVYQGAMPPAVLVIGGAPKIAALVMALQVFHVSLEPLYQSWLPMLSAIAILSIVWGSFMVLKQDHIRRLLGYSTITHVGFIFLGLTLIQTQPVTALFYVLSYLVSVTAIFGVLLVAGAHGVKLEYLADLKGLQERNGLLGLIALFAITSMAGLPFFAGFYAKMFIVDAALRLGLIALICSVVGFYAYWSMVQNIWCAKQESQAAIQLTLIEILVLSLNGVLLIVVGLYPQGLVALCKLIMS